MAKLDNRSAQRTHGNCRSLCDPYRPVPDTHDVGLVILDQPIDLGEYGVLAEANSLDQFATRRGLQDLTFTVSGYGLTYKNQEHNGKPNVSFRERLMALSRLVNLNSGLNAGFNLQTVGNGTGQWVSMAQRGLL